MKNHNSHLAILLCLLVIACGDTQSYDDADSGEQEIAAMSLPMDDSSRSFSVEGLAGPEAVRYDPAQDVYFVANFNEKPNDDANGFISKVGPDGEILSLKFMEGDDTEALNGPRGMVIVDDVLYACDQHGIHGFSTESGERVSFHDLRPLEPSFPNDITATPDGTLYVTDHDKSAIYKIENGVATQFAHGPHLSNPNGITYDASSGGFILGAWEGNTALPHLAMDGTVDTLVALAGTHIDGVEIVGDRTLLASQGTDFIYALEDGELTELIKVSGKPADIGIDTKRNRIAVPFIALNRVDVWDLN